MTKAFIWDLDGTLLDSYDAILAGIEETYTHYGLDFDRASIHSYILKNSVQKLLEKVASETVSYTHLTLPTSDLV